MSAEARLRAKADATKQSSFLSFCGAWRKLDCFAEPVIGLAMTDPVAPFPLRHRSPVGAYFLFLKITGRVKLRPSSATMGGGRGTGSARFSISSAAAS